MVDPEFDEMDDNDDDDDVWDENDEWLMALVTPPRATVTVLSTYEIIMANLPPDHNEFALATEAVPNNNNGWIE
nr:hypothetical protein [Tanacetum cinerariifolium]